MAQAARTVIARLVRSVDFERVLRTRTRASSSHFAVHHIAACPTPPPKPPAKPVSQELSTGTSNLGQQPVDDSVLSAPPRVPDGPCALWLGAVVPKRHARRSVTRSLLKRQIRAVVSRHIGALAGGLWVVRLRAPFDRAHFVSAASDELKTAARHELEQLLASAAKRATAR